jgi:hypothetical protein
MISAFFGVKIRQLKISVAMEQTLNKSEPRRSFLDQLPLEIAPIAKQFVKVARRMQSFVDDLTKRKGARI